MYWRSSGLHLRDWKTGSGPRKGVVALILETLVVTNFATNCYVLGCTQTKEGIIIDPGGEAKRILEVVERNGLAIRYIINTHSHVDHIGANGIIKEATGATLAIHPADAETLKNPMQSLLAFSGKLKPSPPPDELVREGDVIKAGSLELKVIHTPGHTPGGISLKMGSSLFTGDTLFAGSIGRTDFPGGSYKTLIESIAHKLLGYPDTTIIYPGHGPSSTIGEERKYNPFLT